MDKFKLETSLQFPLFKIRELVSFSEVKKPSGIEYILLVLIGESKNKNSKLASLLESFGISKSLLYLFADSIQYLMDQDILQEIDFEKSQFEEFKIEQFKFTERGKKIFAEESIPTGINKEIKIDVFYNIALKELSLTIDPYLEPKPLMDCAITPDFINQFPCERNIENFLNLKKGKGIGVKKEEIITSIEEIKKENWVIKYDCIMNISGDKIEIKFDDLVLQNFFDDYYTKGMVNQAVLYKNKFKFKSSYKDNLNITLYEPNKIVGFIIPQAIDEVLNQKQQLLVTKGNYKANNCDMIISEESIDSYDSNIEFIQVNEHNSIFGYIPGKFIFNNELKGEIVLPLTLKIKITKEELKKLLKPYINTLSIYSENNFKELVKLTNFIDDFDLVEDVLKGYLGKNVESNIVLLNEIRQYALLNMGVLNIYKKVLKDTYFAYLDLVTEDNLKTTLKITSYIPKFLNIPLEDVLSKIFDKIQIKSSVKTYEELVENDFDKSLVLLYVNPVEEALKTRSVDEKTLLDLINYDSALNVLKKITSINDYKDYTYDEESIKYSSFKENYNKVISLQKSIQVFKQQNKALFKNYDNFMTIFSLINDDLNLLENAQRNPNNIQQDLIDKKISSGEFQFVFVNLSIKLETILKEQYNLSGKLSKMLNIAKKEKLIDSNILNDLNDFRESRNLTIHSTDKTKNYSVADLKRWAKEIFDLEAKKNEPSSNR